MTSGSEPQPEQDPNLARAARELRESPEPGWIEISDRIVEVLRSTTRRTWPVRASYPAGSAAPSPDSLSVSDQVVIAAINDALRVVPGCAPSRILLRLDGHECLGAEVSLVAAYGTDLLAAAARCRDLTVETLEVVLGPGPPPGRVAVIDIAFGDVTREDPRS